MEMHREYVFAEQRQDSLNSATTNVEFLTMVRSKDWKLIHYLGENDSGELYDLKNDPGEHFNRWSLPEYREQRDALEKVLLDWRIRSGNVTADRSKSYR